MDHFHEEVVVKRNTVAQNIMYIVATVVMILAAAYTMFSLQLVLVVISRAGFSTAIILDVAFLLFSGFSAVMLFLNRDKIKLEYEYTFTNGIIDFAQVYNNKKRKNLGTMNVKNVEAFGKVASGSFTRYSSMQGVKMTNWFLNRESELYFFYIVKDSAKRIIVMEPSEELVGLIKRYLPHGKFQVN